MILERSVPCALNSRQTAIILRDLSRIINYSSPQREVAVVFPVGLICQGWSELPEWVRSVEVRSRDGKLVLILNTVENISSTERDALYERLNWVLANLVSRPVKSYPRHVFCIGWDSTGTTNITEALRMLGLLSWHFAPWALGLKHRNDQISSPSIHFSGIADYTAV